MGKRIMLVATLVGVLSLGACVDDKESASVEKIRNAKAEQLLSIAELNKADAYAKKVLADADAALKAAETELEKIKAEQEKVLVEEAKVKLEEAKAKLAVQLAGQEEALEAVLLQAKTTLLTAQQNYLNAVKNANDQERTRLWNLLTAYTTATTTLNTYKGELAGLKRSLIQLEYGLVDAETLKEKEIVNYEIQIAYAKTQKALYEKYLTVDPAEAQKAYEAASLEYTALQNKSNASWNEYDATRNERDAVNTWLSNSAYYRKLNDVFRGQTYGDISIPYYTTYIDGVYYYYYDVTDRFNIVTTVPLFSSRMTKSNSVEIIYDDQIWGGTESYSTITDYYTVQKAGFDAFIAAYKTYIKENQQETYDADKKTYDRAVEDEADAKVKAEKTNATQVDKDAYKSAHDNTLYRKNVLDNAKAALDTENERLAKVEEAYAFVTSKEQTDAVTAKVKEYNDLSEKTCELYIQYRKENYAANLKSAEVNALWNIYNNADQIASNIASCDTSITYYERQIADVSSIETKEEAIEKKKVDIANKEAEIALKEKDVANAKAAFEAAAGEEAEADAGNE